MAVWIVNFVNNATYTSLFATHTYVHSLQVAITTPDRGSLGYPYIKISPYR